MATLPVIDLAVLGSEPGSEVAEQLRRAGEDLGFFYIVNHGISPGQIDRALSASRRFFALPEARKDAIAVDARHRGYLGFGASKMDDAAFADLKESFVYGVEHEVPAEDQAAARMIGPNQWPQDVPELETDVMEFFAAMIAAGSALLSGVARALGLAPDFFLQWLADPLARGSVIHYPPRAAGESSEQLGVGAHTDYGLLTLLWQDDVGGLQVQGRHGEWVDVPPRSGSLLVNVGDLLARWSNDRLKSSHHRVVNSGRSDRYSMAVFIDPAYHTVVDPRDGNLDAGAVPHYEPVVAGQHVAKRFSSSFSYRRA